MAKEFFRQWYKLVLPEELRKSEQSFYCYFYYYPTSTFKYHKNIDSDLEGLAKSRTDYPSNSMIRYLKINSIRNKIVQLTDICKTQSRLPDYHFPPFRRGPNSWGKNSLHSKWDTYGKFNCLWKSKYGKRLRRDHC